MIEAWKDDSCAGILKNETVYANYNSCCYKYRAENGVTISTEEDLSFSSHEEADNRMFFHLIHALPGSTVVMQTDGINSLMIALGYKQFFNTLEIWLEAGVQSKNNLRFMNVNSIYSELGETLCKVLPAYHTLSGCDYTASFFKKGKVRPLKLLKKDTDAQIVLSKLSTLEEIDENTISTIEGYVCNIYVSKNICKVNDL